MIPEETILEIRQAHPGYVAHWVYLEHGIPTMVVVRYDKGIEGEKKSKFFDQWHLQEGKWVHGILTGQLPLFGLHSLGSEAILGAILITGGEKCAALLHQLGVVAVTNCLGESAVDRADFGPLRIFKRFILLRDNDSAGVKFARIVSSRLLRVVEDAEIFVCNLTPDIQKGDVVDWIQQYPLRGHGWDGFSELSATQVLCAKTSLFQELDKSKILVQDCPEVMFKPEHVLFDGEPLPLEEQLLPVPPFPLDCLNPQLQEYCRIRAAQTCLPPDFTATAFLGVISGLIGRSYQLEMRPGHDWFESANLWGLLIGNPSSQKSPTIKAVSSLCLTPLDVKARVGFEVAVKTYKERKRNAKKCEIDFDEPEPVRRRFHTDDPTVASLKKLFSSNARGILLRNDEASAQLQKFDKDGCEGDRAFFLSCWSGQESYHDDRLTRESLLDLTLCLAWIGGIQPNTIRQHLQQATHASIGNDGLMQRFQLISYPDVKEEFKNVDVQIPPDLKEGIARLAADLDNICMDVKTLHYGEEAHKAFIDWYVVHQNRTRAEEEEYWQSHLGKIPKLVGSLCIQLHLLDNIMSGLPSDEISLSVFEKALRLADYYIAHARRAYGSTESRLLADARRILRMIRSGKIKARFKASDIYRNCSCSLSEPARTNASLEFLKDRNIVAQEKQFSGVGRHGIEWIVHPNLQK